MLEKEITEHIQNDTRTKNLTVAIRVVGSIAHVEGNVENQNDVALIRAILSQHSGIHGVWDILSIKGKSPRIADIGCGPTKQVANAFGVDKFAGDGIDLVANLENPLPLKQNSFDSIYAIHVLEHIYNLVGLMNEIHRTLRPSGVLHVIAPDWHFPTAVADPTHVRFMNRHTIKYFCEDRQGVSPWKPLSIHTSEDSIFADLQPMKHSVQIPTEEIARWFY